MDTIQDDNNYEHINEEILINKIINNTNEQCHDDNS